MVLSMDPLFHHLASRGVAVEINEVGEELKRPKHWRRLIETSPGRGEGAAPPEGQRGQDSCLGSHRWSPRPRGEAIPWSPLTSE